MVVNEHTLCRAFRQRVNQLERSAQLIEVEAKDEVGFAEPSLHLLRVLVVAHHLLDARQPVKEVGESVGHNDVRLLAVMRGQVVAPGQTRPERIAVGLRVG